MPWSTGTEAARSRTSSINYLSSIRTGKAGGLLFKKKKTARSSNSEGVGKPFLMKKGWKQKHKSANIEKQCQMIIIVFKLVWFGCVFDLHTVIRRFKNMKLPNKWWTLKIYECEVMAGMRPKYKNDAVFIQDPIQCAFNTKSDGLPEQETTDRLQKAVCSFSLWKH